MKAVNASTRGSGEISSIQGVDPPDGNQQPGKTTKRPKQNTFGEQFFDNLPAASSERGTNAYFSITRKRTRQQEIRDVDAGDEQNAGRHRTQHQQC